MLDASNPPDNRKLFLLGQTFSELVATNPRNLLTILCDEEPPGPVEEGEVKEKWEVRSRHDIVADAACLDTPTRVAVVCSAGRGKSTNMTFVEAHIAAEPDGKQLPFLIRLDQGFPSHVAEMEKAVQDPESLLTWLARRVQFALGGDQARHRWALERHCAAGRITLMLDGLDHVMDRKDFVQDLANLLNSDRWRRCPIWISGRREAFKKWGQALFAGSPLRVLQVDPLAGPEIGFFMKSSTGHAWQDDFPVECRHLLATPRTLGLICRVLRTRIPHPPEEKQARQEQVRQLELGTAAGIYYHAYFYPGDPDHPDSQGLLAQGLLADKDKFGLPRSRKPLVGNLKERIERMGLVLGAIAFYMVAERAEGIELNTLYREVGAKLERMGHGTAGEFEEQLDLLRQMDNHTLEFTLFNSDVSTGELAWDNRTVRAFFAAYWAMRYGSLDEDLPRLRNWVIDKEGERLSPFFEFWQLAAEMPDGALRAGKKLTEREMERWMHVFGPCYTPPAQLTGPLEWVQWNREMAYYSFSQMRTRSPRTIASWRARTAEQEAIVAEIEAGWCEIAAGVCHYGASPAENEAGREVKVKQPFRLHQWPVINRWYEAFDPSHRVSRWKNEYQDEEHPLAKISGREGEDWCPVVNVTWYDAWNFAAWLGDHVFLPNELQWEHACRKGTAWDYYFEGGEKELENHAWFETNSKGRTHPMPAAGSPTHRNENGLYDMLGNVWEWCADSYDAKAFHRVLRGGSWRYYGRRCRSAYRRRFVPGDRLHHYGFRLAAVPCIVGAK